MTSEFKPGGYVVATTNRAPLVRGKAYRIEGIDDSGSPLLLRLEGLPMLESASFFRPATGAEAAVCEAARQPKPKPQSTGLAAPDTNPKTRFGMAKPPLGLIPGPAMVHMAEAFRDGAEKYGPANWRVDPVSSSTYVNAALRHLLSWWDGEEEAQDSGVHHLGHAAACLAIIMDAQAQGTLHDDRPTPGVTAALIKERTRPIA